MHTDYIVRLKCPYGDRDQLLMLENREEDLKQILETHWNFECPVHGVQREIPLEGSQRSSWPSSRSQRKETKPAGRVAPHPRSSKRISLHVPVLVYGWSKDEGSFHEETETLLVNASGCLLAPNSRVGLGDTIFITNKATQQEQECRVAYVERDVHGKLRVGAAFSRPAHHSTRGSPRRDRIFVMAGRNHSIETPLADSAIPCDMDRRARNGASWSSWRIRFRVEQELLGSYPALTFANWDVSRPTHNCAGLPLPARSGRIVEFSQFGNYD